jgi:hypothetical protein
MCHLGAQSPAPDLAECAHLQALLCGALELLQLAGKEVEKLKDQPVRVHDQLATRPEHHFRPQDLCLNVYRCAR